MMKYILCVLIAFYTVNLSAQVPMPEKLVGTWKSNLGPFYEQWQKLNDSHFKGVSWYFSHGFPIMMEYLDITAENGQLTLCATVPGQNEGRKVCFAGRDTLSGFIFENLQHDFPKKIAYQFTAENEIRVRLAGDPARDFRLQWKNCFGQIHPRQVLTMQNWPGNLGPIPMECGSIFLFC
jgi:hypothetical protein